MEKNVCVYTYKYIYIYIYIYIYNHFDVQQKLTQSVNQLYFNKIHF